MSVYTDIYNEIKAADDIIITSHIRADGDCVGSAIGLREIIKETFPGKHVYASHEYTDFLSFLGKADEIPDELFETALVISVDNAQRARANDTRIAKSERIIKIDHHPNNDPFGTIINFVEEEKSSCSEIIFDLYLNFPNAKISSLGVEALFTGIITDTGRFKYASVTGDTLKKVGMMYDLGLDACNILNILDETSLEELKFKGYILSHMEQSENGVLYVKIRPEIRAQYNVKYDEASNMVNELSGVKESPIWVLFNEYKPNEIRCRVRSLGLPINDVCQTFGGGGHENASGIVVDSWDMVDKVIEALDYKLAQYKK